MTNQFDKGSISDLILFKTRKLRKYQGNLEIAGSTSQTRAKLGTRPVQPILHFKKKKKKITSKFLLKKKKKKK
jgi:hypothetical protein